MCDALDDEFLQCLSCTASRRGHGGAAGVPTIPPGIPRPPVTQALEPTGFALTKDQAPSMHSMSKFLPGGTGIFSPDTTGSLPTCSSLIYVLPNTFKMLYNPESPLTTNIFY